MPIHISQGLSASVCIILAKNTKNTFLKMCLLYY